MYPYFLLGYYFNQYEGAKLFEKEKRRTIAITGIGAFILFLALFVCFYREDYIYISGIVLNGANAGRQLLIDVYRWVIGLAGSVGVILLLHAVNERWKNSRIWDALAKLGGSSMGVYIISSFVNVYILSAITYSLPFSVMNILIETLMMLLICVLLSKGIEKNYFLSLLFMGGR
jgi:uncharacterized membrane protein YeiB